MLLSLRKNGLTSLFKEVRVFKALLFGSNPLQNKKRFGGLQSLLQHKTPVFEDPRPWKKKVNLEAWRPKSLILRVGGLLFEVSAAPRKKRRFGSKRFFLRSKPL